MVDKRYSMLVNKIPKAFPGYGLAFAETSGFEAATGRGFFEEFFLAI